MRVREWMIRMRKRCSCRPAQRGLTLVELLIAAAILGSTLAYLLGSVISISALNATTHEQAVAVAQVSSILENLRGLSYSQLLAYTPPAVQGLGAGTTVQIVGLGAGGAAVAIPASASTVLPNPVEMRVTITWKDKRARTQSSRASMMIRR